MSAIRTNKYGKSIHRTQIAGMPHSEWSKRFERRALLSDRMAVIDGVVIEPHTPEAVAAIIKATAVPA